MCQDDASNRSSETSEARMWGTFLTCLSQPDRDCEVRRPPRLRSRCPSDFTGTLETCPTESLISGLMPQQELRRIEERVLEVLEAGGSVGLAGEVLIDQLDLS